MSWEKIKRNAERILNFQENEVYIALILFRKKYSVGVEKSSRLLQREVLTIDTWEQKLYKLYNILTTHKSKEYGNTEHANLYLMVNPRDVRKGVRNLKTHLAIWEYDQTFEPYQHLVSRWFSCLQKKSARSRREWYIVDIDIKDENVMLEACKAINNSDTHVFESRNGFHVLAKPFNVQEFNQRMEHLKLRGLIEVKTDDCINLWCGNW